MLSSQHGRLRPSLGRDPSGSTLRFARVGSALSAFAEFAMILPSYDPRDGGAIRRLPTPRATLYYAADVLRTRTSRPETGLYCEGPHARGFNVSSRCREMVGIKIRPGALGVLLGLPAREVRDHTFALDEVWGRQAIVLADRMAELKSADARLALLEHELLRRAFGHARGSDRHHMPVQISRLIEGCNGRVRVRELVDHSGYSPRAFANHLDEGVGLTAKQCIRAARLRWAIVSLARGEDPVQVALSCGYADQSHMIHEFRDLLRLTPAAFMQQCEAFSPIGAPGEGKRALPSREQALYQAVGFVSKWI